MSGERYVALALLAFCLGYGYMATDIVLLPFLSQQGVTARTMPYMLAAAGALISFLLLVMPAGAGDDSGGGAGNDAADTSTGEKPNPWRGLDWRSAGLIMLAVIAYGVMIRPAGFIISTLAFLFFCSYILGERRLKMLIAVYAPIVLCFWWVMTQLLAQSL